MSASAFVRALSVAGLIGSLAIQPAAQAIPIGDFSWLAQDEEACDLFCGPLFSVGNFSDDATLSLGLLGGSFFDVAIDLQTDGGLQEVLLGDVPTPGSSGQSVENLFGVNVLFASLRLTFVVPTRPGSVRLLDIDGNVVAGLLAPGSLLIDYAVDEVPTTVPEPSTLLLLAGGLLGIAAARKAQQRNAPLHSRMKRSFGHLF